LTEGETEWKTHNCRSGQQTPNRITTIDQSEESKDPIPNLNTTDENSSDQPISEDSTKCVSDILNSLTEKCSQIE